MSAILQCLAVTPLCDYFLKDIGHNHLVCTNTTRSKQQQDSKDKGNNNRNNQNKNNTSNKSSNKVCLACQVDKVLLQMFASATGNTNTLSLLAKGVGGTNCIDSNSNNTNNNKDKDKDNNKDTNKDTKALEEKESFSRVKGEPLVTTEMLTAAWKCMSHLSGYEQRDAHEFLHGFLDVLGKHIVSYRQDVFDTINLPRPNNSVLQKEETVQDVVKQLFEGKLRSVLICRQCGTKRVQSEPFVSISLPLVSDSTGTNAMTVEKCLQHFTTPETLQDPVDCPSCGCKTSTTKQHVVSKLPRVLVLHLKRFDATLNKKIEDFCAFPANDLNMGLYLPHFAEVMTAKSESENQADPSILYKLIGTVNHFGTQSSGHYTNNCLVDDKWYHCNDAHVSYAGTEGKETGEHEVLNGEGAYLLFYIRS
jgi:ubiquitin carboxyl-terminal hydrolase 22/27/51